MVEATNVKEEQVKVRFNGEVYEIPREADEDQVRDAMSKHYPEVGDAEFTQDPDTGDWTITRSPGQKG